MDIRYTEEQVMLRDTVRRFLDRHCPFDAVARTRPAGDESRSLWQECAGIGLPGLTVSDELGGFGGGAIERSIVMEEIGRTLAVVPFLSTSVLAAGVFEALPDAAPLLRSLAGGAKQFAVADHETCSDLDPCAIETDAQPEGGGRYRLTGRKIAVLGAPTADGFIVSARIPAAGLGLFLLPADAPGLAVRPHAAIDGSSIGELRLDGVPCAADALLASGEQAVRALERSRHQAIVALGSEAVGICEAAVALATGYVQVRQQFKRPLAEFQAVQHRLAEMYVETQKLRAQVLAALAGLQGPESGWGRSASAVKVQIGTAGMFVAGQGIQLHGGIGMTDEYVAGHYFKRMTVIEALFGSSGLHLQRLASLV